MPRPTSDPPWLLVRPDGAPSGTVRVVGDKSLSHRVLMLSAVADGTTRVDGLSVCRDVGRTRAALEKLGVGIESLDGGHRVEVMGAGPHGLGGQDVTVDCGDSGTTIRLLAGLLAGQARTFRLTGSAQLRLRPMSRITDPLREMGAEIADHEGRAPLDGRGGGLTGTGHQLPKASAQVGSALLLAGLNADGSTSVRYPSPVRDHTERMLADMGAPVRWSPRESSIDGPVSTLRAPGGGHYHVPGDPSAAAFLLGAALLLPGAVVTVPDLAMNPGRTGFFDIVGEMGGRLDVQGWAERHGEAVADVTARGSVLRGIGVGGRRIGTAIDELPLLAVLATRATGRTTVRGAGELRHKECDRISAIVEGLQRMGAEIQELPDGFVVDGPSSLHGARLDGHGDHRIVMALTVAALTADGPTAISDGDRPADSFPGFVRTLQHLGCDIERAPHDRMTDVVPPDPEGEPR